jgi:hypothetical protein
MATSFRVISFLRKMSLHHGHVHKEARLQSFHVHRPLLPKQESRVNQTAFRSSDQREDTAGNSERSLKSSTQAAIKLLRII